MDLEILEMMGSIEILDIMGSNYIRKEYSIWELLTIIHKPVWEVLPLDRQIWTEIAPLVDHNRDMFKSLTHMNEDKIECWT